MNLDFRAFSIVLVAAAGALAACSSSTTGTSSGSSSGGNTTPVTSADCDSRCTKKLTSCSVDNAASECSAAVCNGSPVESQVACLENASCDSITGSSSFTALCPAPSTGSSSGSSGSSGSSSGSSGSTSFTCNGQTCDSTTQYCGQVADSTSDSGFKDDSCKTFPDKCKTASEDTICQCLATELDCPTGNSSMHCGFNNNAISFGCN